MPRDTHQKFVFVRLLVFEDELVRICVPVETQAILTFFFPRAYNTRNLYSHIFLEFLALLCNLL